MENDAQRKAPKQPPVPTLLDPYTLLFNNLPDTLPPHIQTQLAAFVDKNPSLEDSASLRNNCIYLVSLANASNKTTKTCLYCNTKKRAIQFHPLASSADGRHPFCIACEKALSYGELDAVLQPHRYSWQKYQKQQREIRKAEASLYGRPLKARERPASIIATIRRKKMSLRESQRKTEARELRLYGQILPPECREFVETANRDWHEERGYYMMPAQKREVVTTFMRQTDPNFCLPPYNPRPKKSAPASPPEPAPQVTVEDLKDAAPQDLPPDLQAEWIKSAAQELETSETPDEGANNV